MPLWVWITAGFIGIAAVMMTIPLKIQLHLLRKNNDKIEIDIQMFSGLIRRSYRIPFLQLDRGLEGIVKEKNQIGSVEAENRKEIQVNAESVLHTYESMQQRLRDIFYFSSWLMQTLSRVKCTGLRWSTAVGLDDAADTAITAGIIWGLKTSMLGFVFQYIKLADRPHLEVVPKYDQPYFSTELTCRISIRLGYAILSPLSLLWRKLKVRAAGA
jgi:hypothetical protein